MQHRLQELCNESVPISCRSCAIRRSAGVPHVGSPRDATPPHASCRPDPARAPRGPHRRTLGLVAAARPRPRRRTFGLVAAARPRRGHPGVRSRAPVRRRSPPRGGPCCATGRAGPGAVRGCGRVRGRGRLGRSCRHASLRSLARDPPPARDDRRPAGRRDPGGRAAGHGGRVERAPRPALRRPPGGSAVRLRRSAALPRAHHRTGPTARPSPAPDPDPPATTPTGRPPPTRRPAPRRRTPSHRRPPQGHGFEPRRRVRPRRAPSHRRRPPGHGFEPRRRVRPRRAPPDRGARACGFESSRSVAGVGGAGAGARGRGGSVARRWAQRNRMGAGGKEAAGTLTR